MRLLVKVILAVACLNFVLGVCNVFFTPSEYKWFGNIAIFCVLGVQLILCSVIFHSPDKDSK